MVPFFFVHRTLHFSFFFGILPDWGAGGLPSCISITRTLRPVNSSLSFIPSQSFQTFLSSSDDVRSLGDIFLRRSVRERQSTPRTGQEDNRGTGSTKRAQGPGAARPQSHRGTGTNSMSAENYALSRLRESQDCLEAVLQPCKLCVTDGEAR